MKDFKDHHLSSTDTKTLIRIWQYIKPHKGKFFLALGLMLFTILGNVLMPFVFGLAIDLVTSPNFTFEQKLVFLFGGAGIILAILIIIQVLGFIQQITLQKIGFEVTKKIREDVFNHIEDLSIGQINQLPVGKLVTRVMNDPNTISDMFTQVIVSFGRNIMMIVLYCIALLVISWFMGLIVMALFPLIIIASIIFQRLSRTAFRRVRNQLADVNAFLSENISGIKVTQIFNQEQKQLDDFAVRNKNLRKTHMTEIYLFGIYRPFVYLIGMTGVLLTIYFGVQFIAAEIITIGLFITFFTLVQELFEPVQQISETFNQFQAGFASAEKVFDVLDTHPTIVDEPDAIDLETFSGQIEFKNVWFKYETDWVLKDISFKIMPDEVIAFVGSTGSGKSTILSLIVRNYDINEGQILIDGHDIKTLTRSSLRKHIGQMMQDVFLFSGSIKDNITLYDNNLTIVDVMQAAEYVGLDTIVSKFDDLYDHKVLERGNNFSAGERQLISFARAVIYKPSLMILDEATANIDSDSEEIIQESLNKMMNISTMIIVAHRLSTIRHADRIIVMQKGEIKEVGSHNELLKAKGIYNSLYELQVENKDENEEKQSSKSA